MSKPIGKWDHERETGYVAPVKLVIKEESILLAEISAPNAEEAILTALCLMEAGHEMEGRIDPMAIAVARCAEIMNDAQILTAEMAQIKDDIAEKLG